MNADVAVICFVAVNIVKSKHMARNVPNSPHGGVVGVVVDDSELLVEVVASTEPIRNHSAVIYTNRGQRLCRLRIRKKRKRMCK